MKTKGFALVGILAMALVFGGAMYAVAEILPEEENAEDENLADEALEETTEATGEETENNEEMPEMGPRRMRHSGLRFIMDLDENLSDEINITQLKEDLRDLMDELRENGYFNMSREDRDCNRTFEPRDNRTPHEDREGDEERPPHRMPRRMRHRHREMQKPESEIEEPVEEDILSAV